MVSTLVLDNYDSFTFNLVELMRECGVDQIEVRRNDAISVDEAGTFSQIVLSPGPGIPSEAGMMPEIVKALRSRVRMLGVCLGHQCIGEVFGGTLVNLERPFHGVSTPIQVTESDETTGVFRGLDRTISVGRYHSWVVANEGFPAELVVTARDDAGNVMALRHRELDIVGVQFHPESILTPQGAVMMKNWLGVRLSRN
jgi:anthranilate synthase component II